MYSRNRTANRNRESVSVSFRLPRDLLRRMDHCAKEEEDSRFSSRNGGYTVLCAAPDLATAFIEGEYHHLGGDDEVLEVEQL